MANHDVLTSTAPEKIWIQVDPAGDANNRSEEFPSTPTDNMTWCADSVGGQEVEYRRADIWTIGDPQGRQTLRDQFAMAALQGDWSCDNGSSFVSASNGDYELSAAQYYSMADAMMREREK